MLSSWPVETIWTKTAIPPYHGSVSSAKTLGSGKDAFDHIQLVQDFIDQSTVPPPPKLNNIFYNIYIYIINVQQGIRF